MIQTNFFKKVDPIHVVQFEIENQGPGLEVVDHLGNRSAVGRISANDKIREIVERGRQPAPDQRMIVYNQDGNSIMGHRAFRCPTLKIWIMMNIGYIGNES